MDTCGLHDQISVRFPQATSDEGLVAVAKLGDRSAFAELWKRHSRIAFNEGLSDHQKPGRYGRCDSGCVDKGFYSSKQHL